MSREATKRRRNVFFFFAASFLRVTPHSEFGRSPSIRISGIRISEFASLLNPDPNRFLLPSAGFGGFDHLHRARHDDELDVTIAEENVQAIAEAFRFFGGHHRVGWHVVFLAGAEP